MKTFKAFPLFLVLFTLCCSCSKDTLDVGGFNAISEEDLFKGLRPVRNFGFFELRTTCDEGNSFFVDFTQGISCEDSINNEECVSELSNLKPDGSGIILECIQICCSSYIVAQNGEENLLVDSLDDLIEFLGPIDTSDDALLLAQLNSYNLGFNNPKKGGFKKVEKGYEIIATRITADCAPIIYTQYKILVTTNGELEVLEEAELERSENECF